ncbi:hypothetical protein LNI96_12060 [Tenacibaculum dicentrarchi]|nr:hypothetical protein [Tenacibaculum dicentrarchi]
MSKLKNILIHSIILLTFLNCKTQNLNVKTESLTGKYIGIRKANTNIELRLNENGEFKYWKRKGHSSDFTQGNWKNRNDTLILNSKILNGTDSLTFALSSATWIEFRNLEWKIKDNNLTELKSEKRKLIKEKE